LDGFDAVGAFGGEGGEEFRDIFFEDGMAEIRGNFGEGCEDESATGERGVREGEAG
jgi:hypothetical protein